MATKAELPLWLMIKPDLEGEGCVGDADGGLAALWKEDGLNLWPVSGGEEEA